MKKAMIVLTLVLVSIMSGCNSASDKQMLADIRYKQSLIELEIIGSEASRDSSKDSAYYWNAKVVSLKKDLNKLKELEREYK